MFWSKSHSILMHLLSKVWTIPRRHFRLSNDAKAVARSNHFAISNSSKLPSNGVIKLIKRKSETSSVGE